MSISKPESISDMTGQVPEISVYMPTRNRRLLLERAVNSVLMQTYQDFELIIVDDGSSDGTAEYLQELALIEPRVTVFHNETREGACAARNRAIRASRGQFITGIDDDDEFLPHRLQRLQESNTGEYSFVTSAQYRDFGKVRKLYGGSRCTITEAMMLCSNSFARNQVLAKKKDLLDIGLFDESMPSCQDWDIWTRLVMEKGQGIRIPEPLYVAHTGHSYQRISTSENVLQGYARYYEKHHARMSRSNKKDFKFALKRIGDEKFSLQDVIRLMTRCNVKGLLKQYAKSLFPWLAKIRMKRMTG